MKNWLYALALVAGPAWADLTALFDTQQGPGVSIEYRDAQNFRINLDAETWQLVRSGRVYLIASNEGEQEVIPVSDVGEQLSAMGMSGMAQRVLGAQAQGLPDSVSFRSLGRQETVAGYTGTVYAVTTRGAQGESTTEAVLSNDAELATVQESLLSIAEQAMSMLGYDAGTRESRLVREVRAQNLGAVLRYGTELKLREVRREPIAEARLAVPAN